MKNKMKLFAAILGVFVLMFTYSCKDDEESTPTVSFVPVLNENFSFVVEGNNVTFSTDMTGNVWFTKGTGADGSDYPTVDKTVTVNIALKGTYEFTCSSLGSGATITSAPFTITIAQDDLSFLDTEPWLSLTGGQGKSKTWVLDINEAGEVTDQFLAPLQYSEYANDAYTYWNYIQTADDDWSFISWAPDYGGNTWLMKAMDYGTMTFEANTQKISTDRLAEAVKETGTFTIDKATMMLHLNGTTIVRDSARIANCDEWFDLRIFHVSANKLCIGVKRVREPDGTTEDVLDDFTASPWVEIYNFVPKEYKDNYVPDPIPVTDPEIDLGSITLEGSWSFVSANPINWFEFNTSVDLGWAFSNAWTAVADYEDWAKYTEAAVPALLEQSIKFNGDGTFEAVGRAYDDVAAAYAATNSTVTGTYTVDAKGIITFVGKVQFQVGEWMSANTESTWRMVNKAEDGSVWFGIVEPDAVIYVGDAKYKTIHLMKAAK